MNDVIHVFRKRPILVGLFSFLASFEALRKLKGALY